MPVAWAGPDMRLDALATEALCSRGGLAALGAGAEGGWEDGGREEVVAAGSGGPTEGRYEAGGGEGAM